MRNEANDLRYVETVEMASGYALFLYADDRIGGAIVYYSDDVPGGVEVWNTALVGPDTIAGALAHFLQTEHKQALKSPPEVE